MFVCVVTCNLFILGRFSLVGDVCLLKCADKNTNQRLPGIVDFLSHSLRLYSKKR
jgi:hypothetical protein